MKSFGHRFHIEIKKLEVLSDSLVSSHRRRQDQEPRAGLPSDVIRCFQFKVGLPENDMHVFSS